MVSFLHAVDCTPPPPSPVIPGFSSKQSELCGVFFFTAFGNHNHLVLHGVIRKQKYSLIQDTFLDLKVFFVTIINIYYFKRLFNMYYFKKIFSEIQFHVFCITIPVFWIGKKTKTIIQLLIVMVSFV